MNGINEGLQHRSVLSLCELAFAYQLDLPNIK